MKQTINVYQFRDAFLQSDTYKNNFSYDRLTALFDYLEEVESCTAEMELDVVAICCDFQEMENVQEFNEQYEQDCKNMEEVDEYHTTVIPIDDERFIIYQY